MTDLTEESGTMRDLRPKGATPTPAREGLPELPFSPYLVSEWNGPSMTDRTTWTAYTAAQMHAYALAAIAGREAQGHASQPTPGGGEVFYRCEDCGTGEVELTRTCHNSSCGHYAQEASVYKGWDAALPHPQPEEADPEACAHDEWDCSSSGRGYVCAECGEYMKDKEPDLTTQPPPSDAAQGVQAREYLLMGERDLLRKQLDHALDMNRRMEAAIRAHKGEGNG